MTMKSGNGVNAAARLSANHEDLARDKEGFL